MDERADGLFQRGAVTADLAWATGLAGQHELDHAPHVDRLTEVAMVAHDHLGAP